MSGGGLGGGMGADAGMGGMGGMNVMGMGMGPGLIGGGLRGGMGADAGMDGMGGMNVPGSPCLPVMGHMGDASGYAPMPATQVIHTGQEQLSVGDDHDDLNNPLFPTS